MKILHISAECYPIAKVGGLADVVGSLPKYQNKQGITSQVIMPFYDNKFTNTHKFITVFNSEFQLGEINYPFTIKKLKNNSLGFDLFLVDIPELLHKKYVYSNDDTERFLAFQIATLNWILTWKVKPTIIHCHDHHTGLIPFMMSQCFKYDRLKMIPTVLTIHNAQYQGWFSHNKLNLFPAFNFKNVGLLDWDGSINPLAAAIKCTWKVTTVSPSYMEELIHSANGLESLLKHEVSKCKGVLNGIDTEVWNAETDTYLIKNYKISATQSGKKRNKLYLCNQFKLNSSKPLFIFIGRLVGEKGAELLPEVFEKALTKNELSILVLGSGNVEIEKQLGDLKAKFKGKYNSYIGYNEKLAHIMYAGADFLLMPSRVEPCGLNQLYALRYGTIPVVRSIGGLKDTVIDISKKDGVGIVHKNVAVNEIIEAMDRAVELYNNPLGFKKIRKRGMQKNYSWEVSATSYINIYKSLKA
ncbi:glycogen/starch synthase [Lutibacter sp.]|uniref:glycogen synthase n=1 Tax=Lutibacter sp. TaxID=1925666 RepID=UPI0025BFF07D|nr:glycogen/starch synthase [Lutibacter sp.]MCF6181604.1 glycogen/starch synthase [Lutibacter sp.]